MNWKGIVDYCLARLSENSTWRGLILLATAGGATIDPEKGQQIILAGITLVGLINVFRRAPAPSAPNPPTPPTP